MSRNTSRTPRLARNLVMIDLNFHVMCADDKCTKCGGAGGWGVRGSWMGWTNCSDCGGTGKK